MKMECLRCKLLVGSIESGLTLVDPTILAEQNRSTITGHIASGTHMDLDKALVCINLESIGETIQVRNAFTVRQLDAVSLYSLRHRIARSWSSKAGMHIVRNLFEAEQRI